MRLILFPFLRLIFYFPSFSRGWGWDGVRLFFYMLVVLMESDTTYSSPSPSPFRSYYVTHLYSVLCRITRHAEIKSNTVHKKHRSGPGMDPVRLLLSLRLYSNVIIVPQNKLNSTHLFCFGHTF